MELMISQPMNGKTNEQIKNERKDLVQRLTEEGHEVVNTIFDEEPTKDVDEAIYYLAKSIEYIGRVDGVVFMPNWNKARGCKIEHEVAVEYGKKVFYCN